MKKYRYMMGGMFTPTDGEEYEINIPSPFLHDSEREAMKDSNLGYRFAWLKDANGPEILIFERENFEVVGEGDEKHLKTWVEGNVIKTYTFEEFKAAGGYIRMLKPECKGSGFIDCNTDFLDTDKTFRDVFPSMNKQKLYYIDDEAYCVEEVNQEAFPEPCFACDYRYICPNVDKDICVTGLEPGNRIRFRSPAWDKPCVATVKEITDTLCIVFEEGWGINGIQITDIEILSE